MNEIIIEGVDYEFINELYSKVHDRFVVSLHKNGHYIRIPRTNWVRIMHNNKHMPRGFILHHIDHNRKNDVIENLQLVTRGEHNKLHADDINHYMFRKGHSYWSHPKSEQHKERIKKSHTERANKIREIALDKVRNIFKDNPDISCEDCNKLLGRTSHKIRRRLFGTTFRLLKKEICEQNKFL